MSEILSQFPFFENAIYAHQNIEIILKISPSHKSKVVLLNTANNLLITRQKLKEDYDINDTLLKFLWKYSENDEKIDALPEIELKDERKIKLCKIIDKGILYMNSCVDWNHLNEKNKLDYGCTMTFDEIKKANKRAFIMKNCELKELVKKDECQHSTGSTENNKSNYETSSSYHFIKHAKASLEFIKYLELTPDFIKEVEGAIVSKDPTEKFKQIIEEYEHLKEIAINTNAGGALETSISGITNYSKGSSNYQKFNCTKLIGGDQLLKISNIV
ncbi:hypothetical protein RhiirA5_494601 [Rhizophagus irregularis]|uniref:Uncharacterized protein n=1 Tax=Rhizophagus irregularis TaxID=588596 RepID=A0A2N0Q8I9_9GLOM|nr:hypothetical protein RhiirA5_494601 [Rhizophagus irregularis]PKC59990.1 hypothetical protein RhiirA1_468650 [Rhizophagus irregularis]